MLCLPFCYRITEQLQEYFYQTFRVCLRYTEVILGNPRRHLRDRQLPPEPLRLRYGERLVCLPIKRQHVGEDVTDRENKQQFSM